MGRRGNGEGSVYRQADGMWAAAIVLNGRRVVRRRKTQRQALEALKELRLETAAKGSVEPLVSKAPKLGEWLQTWLQHNETRWKPETLRRYRGQTAHLAKLAGLHLDQITTAHIRRLHKDLRAGGLSDTSVGHVHALLRTALNAAIRDDLLATNVAARIPLPRRSTPEQEWLTDDEVRKLLANIAGTEHEVRILLGLLGLRQGEVLGLRWADIDFDAGMLTVRRSITRSPDGLIAVKPKSARSARTIGLPARVVETCKAARGADGAYIIGGTNGAPMHPASDWRRVKAALRAAGVRDVRVHDLRHSTAVMLLLNGADLREVADHLGHSTIQTTFGTYGHVADTQRRKMADTLQRGFDGQ